VKIRGFVHCLHVPVLSEYMVVIDARYVVNGHWAGNILLPAKALI
jgi:hypothetical protein